MTSMAPVARPVLEAKPTAVGRHTKFRANPGYRIVTTDRLSLAEREACGECDDPEVYGLLVPRESAGGLEVSAVDRDTALLFLTLQDAGPLPRYMWTALGESAIDVAVRLVLDGVLEVEHENKFVASAAACEALGLVAGDLGSGRLAGISYEALRSAGLLEKDHAQALAGFLYRYNREPLSPRWKERIPDQSAAAAFCGWESGGHATGAASDWTRQPVPGDGWISWRSSKGVHGPRAGTPVYKLYVSPTTEALPEAFGVAVEDFATAGAFAFKVGADLEGLLRPDKLVAYFSSFEALAEASSRLAADLDGIPPQGVPFTAESSADGLLSWGVDPPSSASIGMGVESWRLWIVRQLASALIAARAADAPDPIGFALQRLQVRGVDTTNWAPTQLMWKEVKYE